MRLLLAATIVAGMMSLAHSPAEAAEASCDTTPVVAHRAIVTNEAENSKGAVRASIEAGVPFEVDLRTTADDSIVLMHDQTITRTTNGRGRVAGMTAAKIARYRTADRGRVPFVGFVLRRVRDNPAARVYLDLKSLSRAAHRDLASRIADYGITDQVTAIAFGADVLADFRARSPGVATQHIEKRNLPTPQQAETYGGVSVFVDLVTEAWVEEMHDRDVTFSMRIDDRPDSWDKGVAAGVESIMSDDLSGYDAYCTG